MNKSKEKIRRLRRRQLDRLCRDLTKLSKDLPLGGWIRDVRGALGMSAAQMARRLSVAPSTIKKLEESEAKQTIEIQTLQRIAASMNCRLIYAIVPDPGFGTLEAILKNRAIEVSTKIVEHVSHTMALEDQSVLAEEHNIQIQETAENLVRTLDKRLWEES